MRESGNNGASSVLIGTAGSNALEISNGQDITFKGSDSTKNVFFDKSEGALGLGTTSPASKLHIVTVGGTNNVIRLDTNQNATRVTAKVVGGENHLVLSSNNNSEDVVITGSRVGIKENSPDSILHIKDGNPDLILENTGTGTGQLRVGHFTNGAFIGTYSDDGGGSDILRVGTHSGDERLRITSDGNIGIGYSSTTITDARVRIKGKNNSTTAFSDGVMVTSANESVFKRYSWTGIETQGGIQFSELTGGKGETMRITTTGLVGIGTSSIAGILHCNAASGVDGPVFDSGGTNNTNHAFLVRDSANTQLFRINNNGNVGIGTQTPARPLEVNGGVRLADDSVVEWGGTATAIYGSSASNVLFFKTGSSEKMRLNNDGDLIIGATTTPQGRIEVVKASGGSNFDAINLRNHAGDANSAVTLNFIKSTDATNTAARSYIRSTRSGSNSYLDIATSNSPAFRMTTDGKIGMGADLSSIDATLTVNRDVAQTASLNRVNQTMILKNSGSASADSRTSLYFSSFNASNQLSPSAIACLAGTNYQSTLAFYTNGNGNGTGHLESHERMRLNASGDLLVGTTSTSNAATGFKVFDEGKQLAILRGDSSTHLFLNKLTGNDGTVATFAIATATKGTISISSTATAYNTSSDYRLKENVVSISDGITRLKTLKPSRFNFKIDASTTVDGFLAHEVSSIVPEAITGEKDAVDDKGEIDPQQIDQSKLVPLLTAALQEAITKIEKLETKVAALEAK